MISRFFLLLPKINPDTKVGDVYHKKLEELWRHFNVDDAIQMSAEIAQRQGVQRQGRQDQVDRRQDDDNLVEIPDFQIWRVLVLDDE